jgi:ribonuclease HI
MIGGVHYATLATDASCNTKRAGMAYYLRDDDGIDRDAWYVDGVYSSTQAEWMALERALELLATKKYWPDTRLIVYCDNTTMLRIIDNKLTTTKARKNWGVKAAWAQTILAQFDSVEARHVPAHTGKGNLPRYALNRWCDFNARAMVRHGRFHEYRHWRKNEKSTA